jgi:NAD-dependent SIR2 family protein deacetylase
MMDRPRRKRSRPAEPADDTPELCRLLADPSSKILAFTGSGISVAAGLSAFSTAGGLYEKARKRYKLKEGKDLFTWPFYAKRPEDCNSFLADVASELKGKQPTQTHRALFRLAEQGRLVRHYTMNIDGLTTKAGLKSWSPPPPPGSGGAAGTEGSTIELHGTCEEVVCKGGHRAPANAKVRSALQARKRPTCDCEGCDAELRWRVMLYDDKEGDLVTDSGCVLVPAHPPNHHAWTAASASFSHRPNVNHASPPCTGCWR